MTLALLGTGLLGRAIAERLQSVGHSVTVYNRTTSKALPLQACGITVVTRPEQAIAQTDCVVLMLADAAAIRAVLLTPASLAVLRGKTVIQMGTIAQEESLALQAEIERVGGSYCEAPVLGSLAEAQTGTLFVMVGGTEGQFVQWNPLFRSLSREPRLIGSVGKAASLKLALNQLIAAEISAFALSLGLGQRAGVPVDTFMAILRESALFAPAFEKKLPRLLTRDYQHPNFSTRHLLKDVELFLKEASGYELTTSGLEGIRPVLERTIAQGLGEADYASLYETVNPKP
ncbi:MAG: NAD(P)-dependent oxidoreductase [Nitrospirota bacterium]|nr:NAD(P)-dependent oxidoreductase [Nitrospirota bacterium]